MKHIFNAHTLVSVKIEDRREDYRYYYVEYKKGGFLRHFIKQGWRHIFDNDYWTEDDIINEGRIIENNKVYYKPYTLLTFTNGQTYRKEFNTYEEALKWGNEQAKTGIQVRLEF